MADDAAVREAQLRERLCRRAGCDPGEVGHVVAPLRVCPLGAHIDHQGGTVSGMTLDRDVVMAFAPRQDRQIIVESAQLGGPVSFDLEAIPDRAGDWADYLRGAALMLQAERPLDRGLDGVVSGDMPVGGLSSSAAVVIAYLLALQAVNGQSMERLELIRLARAVENDYVGVASGVLDQSVILSGSAGHLTVINCARMEIQKVALGEGAGQFAILVVHSGVPRSLASTGFNARVAECNEAALRLLERAGMPSGDRPLLGRVPVAVFEAEACHLPGPLRRRATHYFGEVERVALGVEAFAAGDLACFGELMTASGASSIVNYESGSPELVLLYDILRGLPGVLGTRFSGAGFGGSCIALVDPEAADPISAEVTRRYLEAYPRLAATFSVHLCRPNGPARVVRLPRSG